MSSDKQIKQSNDKLPEIIFAAPALDSSSISYIMGKLNNSSIYWPSSGKMRAFGNGCLQIPEENTLSLMYQRK